MDDEALVIQALAGDCTAFDQLTLRWAGRVTGFCHSRVHGAERAEECAQETLVRAWGCLSTLHDPARFGSWLIGIAVNVCQNWLKSRSNHHLPLSGLAAAGSLAAPATQDPSQEAERNDEHRQLLQAVEAMPEDLRTVLMMFYYGASSYHDIAEALGVSPSTVNARLTKARASLRARFAAGPPSPAYSGVGPAPAEGQAG